MSIRTGMVSVPAPNPQSPASPIDCVETLARLLVLGMGYEVIIHGRCLEIRTKKGSMDLDEFERLPNARKRDHIARYPIGDLFVHELDADFRNAIGHHSAHYNSDADRIILVNARYAGRVSQVVGYTEFCEKVLNLFGAFELATIYYHDTHLATGGRFVWVTVRPSLTNLRYT
jgi:hypothetical protein